MLLRLREEHEELRRPDLQSETVLPLHESPHAAVLSREAEDRLPVSHRGAGEHGNPLLAGQLSAERRHRVERPLQRCFRDRHQLQRQRLQPLDGAQAMLRLAAVHRPGRLLLDQGDRRSIPESSILKNQRDSRESAAVRDTKRQDDPEGLLRSQGERVFDRVSPSDVQSLLPGTERLRTQ